MKDYYAILGVERGASQEDVQRAFRTLAHKYHPDKEGGDVGKFKEVNEAYQVLGNEQKRAQYDATGSFANGFDPRQGAGFDFSDFSVNFGGNGSFSDIFDAVRGAFTGSAFRGADVVINVELTFEESILGTTKRFTIPYRRKPAGTVEIPFGPGIFDGAELIMRERGEPAPDPRLRPGDLHVRVRVKGHPQFRREKRDVVCDLKLTVTEALLGAVKEIVWVNGTTVSVTVPERTRHGDRLPVTSVALPPSDQFNQVVAVCAIAYPKKRMSGKVRELLDGLQKEGW